MKNILSYIEKSTDKMVELERVLTCHKALAPENGGDGEKDKADALVVWLLNNGFNANQIERIDVPDERVSSKSRPNIIVTIDGESNDYCVWSMTHLDVVPEGDTKLWKSNPWEVTLKDGILFGRGVEDNQQGIVSSVFAALSFIKNGIKPSHTFKLLFCADEEVGSAKGAIWLLKNKNLFNKNDLILIPDGGDSEGKTIEIAEKNLLWLKVHVYGKQVHGSRPDTGINACLAACDLSLALNNLENIFNEKDKLFEPDYSTFQPTMRLANVSGINIIPGEETFCMDCRILPCYSLNQVLAQVEIEVKACEEKYGVQICYEVVQSSESPATDKNAPVVQKLKEAIKAAHNIDAVTIGIGGGTVGAEFRRLGYDCAVWSTLDECAHMPNEYCKIENIVKDAKTLAYMLK